MPDYSASSASHPLRVALWTNLLFMTVFPIIIFHVASPYLSQVEALLLAAVPPVLRTLTGLLRSGRLNFLGVLALVSIGIKLIGGLAFQSTQVVLVSDSLITGVYGLLLLASLPLGKPLLLLLMQNMLTMTPSAQQEHLMKRWQTPGARSFFTLLTALLGAGLLLELVVRTLLVFTVPVDQFLVLSPLIRYGLFGVMALVAFGMAWQRRRTQASTQGHGPSPRPEVPEQFAGRGEEKP